MPERDEATVKAIEQRLSSFIACDLGWQGDATTLVGPGARDLSEVLDSQELLEMLTFVEDTYAIEVADEELVPENFATLPRVASMVSSKMAATPS